MTFDWDFVRIPASPELLMLFVTNGKKQYEIIEGIDDSYKLTHIYQCPQTLLYYFYFIKGDVPHGIAVRDMHPNIINSNLLKKESSSSSEEIEDIDYTF